MTSCTLLYLHSVHTSSGGGKLRITLKSTQFVDSSLNCRGSEERERSSFGNTLKIKQYIEESLENFLGGGLHSLPARLSVQWGKEIVRRGVPRSRALLLCCSAPVFRFVGNAAGSNNLRRDLCVRRHAACRECPAPRLFVSSVIPTYIFPRNHGLLVGGIHWRFRRTLELHLELYLEVELLCWNSTIVEGHRTTTVAQQERQHSYAVGQYVDHKA